MFKVDNTSTCTTCNQKVNNTQCLKCVECDGVYHAVCTSAADKEAQICNISFLKAFLTPSVKCNFTWVCDHCKTQAESDKVATLRQVMNEMSKSHAAQITTLTESIETLSDRVNSIALNFKPDETKPTVSNNTVWDERERIRNIKSALVVKPDVEGNKVNLNTVKKIVSNAGIPVDSVIESSNGETFVNLPDAESRDRVSQLLEEKHAANPVVKLHSKLPSVAIMGITAKHMLNDANEEMTPEDIEESIHNQNKSIAEKIDQGSELKVVFVRKPPRGKKFYNVVVRVSPDIRDLIKRNRNKLHIGVSVHKIVDRFHVRRCNRCMEFGHYADRCESEHVVCGFCAKDHMSDECPDKHKDHRHHKCINCSAVNKNAFGHPAFWTKCPTYVAAQEKMKKTISYDYDLN